MDNAKAIEIWQVSGGLALEALSKYGLNHKKGKIRDAYTNTLRELDEDLANVVLKETRWIDNETWADFHPEHFSLPPHQVGITMPANSGLLAEVKLATGIGLLI